MSYRRVVITGVGPVSPVGIGRRAFWAALMHGRSGIRKIRYIDTTDYPVHMGGEIQDFQPLEFLGSREVRRLGRGAQFLISATKLALDDARWRLGEYPSQRVGVTVGTTMADVQALERLDLEWVKGSRDLVGLRGIMQHPSSSLPTYLALYFGFLGPNLMIPTACSAGNYAICYGYDLIRCGRADAVVAGGVDPLSRIVFTAFNCLHAVAPDRCQPFDQNRKGMMVSEGAGVLILEDMEQAVARGAPIYAELLGYGMSCDARHMTIPSVSGVVRVMRRALSDAGITPEKVSYISAHGTGTQANDRTECAAIKEVFGEHSRSVPTSSIKSMMGHTMGAASALEAIACALAVSCDEIPPTINYETPDPECDIDCVPNFSRKVSVEYALNNSFAFGGNNAAVVLGKSRKSDENGF